jgi:hypothetical protein
MSTRDCVGRVYPLVRVTTNGDAVMYDTAPETTMTERMHITGDVSCLNPE